MTNRRRDIDPYIDEMRNDIKEIKNILGSNGGPGVCEQVRKNSEAIDDIKKRPGNIKNWLLGVAIILNTLIAGIALYKGGGI